MKFTLEIELGNDAMRHYNDIREAIHDNLRLAHLESIARNPRKPSDGDGAKIMDVNGNTVGKWEVIDETACKVCGVSAAKHGHFDATNPKTHQWKAK